MPAPAWHGSDQTVCAPAVSTAWGRAVEQYALNTWPFLCGLVCICSEACYKMVIYYSTRTRCRPDLGPVLSVVSCRVGSVTVSGRRHGGWAEHLRLLKDSGQGDGRAHGMRGYRPLLPRATQLGKKRAFMASLRSHQSLNSVVDSSRVTHTNKN